MPAGSCLGCADLRTHVFHTAGISDEERAYVRTRACASFLSVSVSSGLVVTGPPKGSLDLLFILA